MDLDCPTCQEPTEHRVLKEGAHNVTVECTVCGDVRSAAPPRIRIVELKVVISDEGQAQTERFPAPRDETIAVGMEFELGDHRLIVTGIELPGRNVEEATAEEIKVLHAKVFDTVPLRLSLNEGDITHAYRLDVDPDRPVSIGEVFKVQGRLVVVKTIKSDQNRTLHRGVLPARNVVRCFCDPAPWRAKAGQVIEARKRGAPPTRRGKPTSRVKAPRATGRRRD